jgi:hypothetical protein
MQARGRAGGRHTVPASGAGTLQARRSPQAHVNRRIGGAFRGLRSQRERVANARRPAQGGRVIFPAATRSLGHAPAGGLLRGIVAGRWRLPREWCRLGSEAGHPDHLSTLAGWTASSGLFLPGRRRRGRLEPWRGPAEPLEHTAAEAKGGLPSPMRQHPILAETLEARGEHRQETTPHELDRVEGHRPLAGAMGVIFPREGELPRVERPQAMMRNRHAMGRARQRFPHVGRAAQRRFGIAPPRSVRERGQELLPRLGGSQRMPVARQRQAALRMILAEPGQEETPKHPTQHADWEEEGGAARQPLGPIRGQSTSGNHTVEMGMMTTTVTIP